MPKPLGMTVRHVGLTNLSALGDIGVGARRRHLLLCVNKQSPKKAERLYLPGSNTANNSSIEKSCQHEQGRHS
jgi:hypothetical protein